MRATRMGLLSVGGRPFTPMNLIRQIMAALRGRKTYLIGALMVLLGWLRHDPQMILEGLGLSTLRAGVAKATPPKRSVRSDRSVRSN